MIDISPGALGGNTLGANDGTGHPINPITGQPYGPDVVLRGRLRPGDGRVLGRRPELRDAAGHWNVLANLVSDELAPDLRIGGRGDPVDRLAVGRQAVPRDQRRGARRRDRGLGPQGLLRLGAADLDDPVHGRPRAVERSALPCLRPRGTAAGPGPDRADHRRDDGARQRHAALAGHEGEIAIRSWARQPRRTPRPRSAAWPGSSPSRLGAVPAADVRHARRSRATSRATARSAGPRRRCWSGSRAASTFPAA